MNLKDTFLAISLLFTMVIFGGCESPKSNDSGGVNSPRTGIWRGVILEQGEEMPFNFELLGAGPTLQMKIINATEKITVDEIEFFDDSIRFNMHILHPESAAKQQRDDLVG